MSITKEFDTITAISTPLGEGAIGIVRLSGTDAVAIANKVFKGKNLETVASHTINYGHIVENDETIDEVMVSVMRAPKTFTREDVVEINTHGGVAVTNEILQLLIRSGARMAEPGEFTKRAFLNGRMDLSQAEAVMDVIQAKNEYALRSSMDQLRGSVQKAIRDIREKLIYHIAYIESALDDPEHISLDGYPQELLEVVDNEQKEVKRLLKTSSDGKMIQEGIQTVILGKPNAGKSSLLNLLIGENRAIVTDIAGTTRDILEEYITLHGISLKIIDTAGIRETKDIVEKIGVDRAREMAQKADLILYVVDSSVPLDENDEEIMAMLAGKKAIILYNKTDLQPVFQTELLKEKTGHPVIPISAKEEKGITELEEQIKEMFFGGEISFNDEVYITNARHKAALEEADKSLDLVRNSIEMGMPEDFFSIDLMNAYENLGKILGESVGEDLVNEIFSKFCMGK